MLSDAAPRRVHQQVFLEVWQRASSYDPQRASILTWIMTIARSRAIDELRRRVPEPQDPGEHTRLGLTEDDDPERSPDALVERWRVAHLLSRLRAEESELLRMRFYEGLSQAEIAERTEIPLGTVKMRMVGRFGACGTDPGRGGVMSDPSLDDVARRLDELPAKLGSPVPPPPPCAAEASRTRSPPRCAGPLAAAHLSLVLARRLVGAGLLLSGAMTE